VRLLKGASILLAATCLTAMTVLTCTNVIARYFFKHPIFGADEIVNALLGTAIFSGMIVVALERGHVSVSLFERFLIRHMGRGYIRLYDATSLLGALAVTGILGWKVLDLLNYPEYTVVLRIPQILIVGVLALLSAASSACSLFALFNETVDAPSHEPHGFE